MNVAGVGGSFEHAVVSGPLLVAALVALVAGVVSFLSPCVLPLVPGYLSYVTGLTGPEPAAGGGGIAVTRRTASRSRTFAGAWLFVLGFTAVFVSYGALFGGLGRALLVHQRPIERILGVVTILLGLAFAGLVPGLQRELRVHRLPSAGLLGAPVLGVVFGLGWTPCVGPTLGAVQTLAFSTASAGKGAFLSAVYCIGLGVPFVLAAFGFRWLVGAFAAVRRHAAWVTRIGGVLLVVLGVLLVGGWWDEMMTWMRAWAGSHAGIGTSV
ncbi:MAG: cytochrome c biogenesis CcdA family protein [Mycobacteriales bacterium]|nr:MAG: cytochrome C biogenesis protein ResC [Pseudonocardiales bacterium]